MTRIAVLGPGGVGGFLAAALARAGDAVNVIARPETASLIAERGIEVHSLRLGDFTAHPAASDALREPVELLFVATKATTLESALARIETKPELVVPLLNGLDHIGLLRERFGPGTVPAATIRIESDRPSPGVIVQTSPFLRVELAADDPALKAKLAVPAAVLEAAGIPARVGQSEAQVLWSKLVRLNALACTTSACGGDIGFVRSDPQWRAALIGCIEEATVVAGVEGAELDPAAVLAELVDAHPELGSSMQRDIAAGREPELDAIPGAVLRAAGRHRLRCPTIARLSAEIAQRAGLATPAL